MWFQSTHPRGVRRLMPRPALSFGGFNPRTRVGCDYCMPKVTFVMALFQSTHPRGVRRALSGRGSITCRFQSTHPRGVRLHFHAISLPEGAGFNPRTRVGCDGPGQADVGQGVMFQSTHPRGVRLSALISSSAVFLFQSTHPRGVRLSNEAFKATDIGFQSTHPRGVRHAVTSASGLVSAFQSTHPRGVRHQHSQQQAPQQGGFNPRTRVGCD